MTLTSAEIDRRMEFFFKACRTAGVKLTHQRIEIFREVAKTEEHPSAETIFAGVRSRIPTVSLDTVYRTLSMLEKLGIISRVHALCDRARFDANMNPHHHFVCLKCGMVRDFTSPGLDAFRIPAEVQTWGEVKSIYVELRSVCGQCAVRDDNEDLIVS